MNIELKLLIVLSVFENLGSSVAELQAEEVKCNDINYLNDWYEFFTETRG